MNLLTSIETLSLIFVWSIDLFIADCTWGSLSASSKYIPKCAGSNWPAVDIFDLKELIFHLNDICCPDRAQGFAGLTQSKCAEVT